MARRIACAMVAAAATGEADLAGFTIRRKTALLLFGPILALLAAEAGLRLGGLGNPPLYRADPDYGYALQPNQKTTLRGKVYTVNAMGFRGALPERPDVTIIGDSITDGGRWIDDRETLPALFAARTGIAVAAPAAGGWAIANEAAWLRRHGTLGAPTLVLQIADNDVFQPMATSAILRSPRFPQSKPWAIEELWMARVLPRLGPGIWVDPGLSVYDYARGKRQRNFAAVTAMRDMAAARGARFVLLYVPSRLDLPVDAWRKKLADWAAREGVVMVTAELSARDYRDGIHPTPHGNARIAAQLAAALTPPRSASSTAVR